MKRKLKSRRGASITFALLLFLVCAVIGSVVLAAGTAAAGRMAGLAKSDQRYYSVTSAARLFQDQFEGEKVTIVRTHNFERTDTLDVKQNLTTGEYYYEKVDGTSPETNHNYSIKMIVPDSPEGPTTIDSLLKRLACDLVLGNTELTDTTDSDTGWKKVFPVSESFPAAGKTASLTVGDKKDLAVDIEIKPSGAFTPGGGAQLALTFMNHRDETDTKTPQFKLRMTLLADAEKPATKKTTTTDAGGVSTETIEEIPASSEEVAKTEYIGTQMKVTSKVTETKTTSVTWRVVSLEVVGKGNAA